MSKVGRSSKSSSLGELDFWDLSKQNVRSIEKLVNVGTLLNKRQCEDLSAKLSDTTQNIQELVLHCRAPAVLFRPALENLYRHLEKAKVLVKQCREKDWCQASVFQSQNHNAFRDVLLDISLCYNAIFEQARRASKDWHGHPEDLRQSSVFLPAPASDVYEDQQDLERRLEDLAKKPSSILRKWSGNKSRGVKLLDHARSAKAALTRCLARYILVKLKCASEQSQGNPLDTCSAIFWAKETEPPETWGNYRLLGAGSGANGVCSTTWLGVPCAKKEFHGQATEKFFLEEAGILAHLKHPCIVSFICCGNGKEKGDRFIAMELMEKSLLDLIEEQKDTYFSLPVVIDMILQIARGMCYLHEQGVAHCDLKPGNVVVRRLTNLNVSDHFCVKLVDFGMAKTKVQVSKSSTISVRGVGTTRYRAPEVHPKARETGKGKANWFRADVYSFAITCAHVLSLKVPFGDMPVSERYDELKSGSLRPELSSNCPQELVTLLSDCWSSNPLSRPSFVEISTWLETFKHKQIGEFRHLRGFSIHEQSNEERKHDFSIGFDFIKRKMEEQFSVSKPFDDINTKDEEEGERHDSRGNNVSVSVAPSTRHHTQIRRASSLTKFFYNLRVTLHILLEPLSNRLAFWTNQGGRLLGSLTEWVPIPARNNGQQVPSRSKWRVESRDLKSGRFLGQGCSGIFYEVTWSGLQGVHLLARKDIPGVPSDVFEYEAARLVDFGHPNIVRSFCWTVDKRSCTLVMEYVKDDLYTVVQKRKEALWKDLTRTPDPQFPDQMATSVSSPFKLLDAILIMLKIATGMEYLHGRGIAHGDLKPSNVLVDLEADPVVVKVADYGLIESKRLATLMSKHAYCLRMIEWSAPEAFEDYFGSVSEDLDYIWTSSLTSSEMSTTSVSLFENYPVELQPMKGDSYSFGLTCAYILGGQIWNANLSPGEMRKQISSDKPLRPELPFECPESLTSLISSCWDADPERRPIFSHIRQKLQEISLEQQEEEAQPEESLAQEYVEDLVQGDEDLAQGQLEEAESEVEAQQEHEAHQVQLEKGDSELQPSMITNLRSLVAHAEGTVTSRGGGRLPEAKWYKGVRWRPERNRWIAEMKPPKVKNKVWFGEFASQTEAARVVDVAFHHYRKRLNFPNSTPQTLSAQRTSEGLNAEEKLNLVKEQAKWVASTFPPSPASSFPRGTSDVIMSSPPSVEISEGELSLQYSFDPSQRSHSGLAEASTKSKSFVISRPGNRGRGSLSLLMSERPLSELPRTSDEYTEQATEAAPASTNFAKWKPVISEESNFPNFRFNMPGIPQIELLQGESSDEAIFDIDIGNSEDRVSQNVRESSIFQREQKTQIQTIKRTRQQTRPDQSAVESNRMQKQKSWPYFDPDFDTISNPPQVAIENDKMMSATVITVNSDKRHDILLDVVQLLTDLELVIRKCDIFSDGEWFYHVFEVVDRNECKVLNEETLQYIHKSLSSNTKREQPSSTLLQISAGLMFSDHTVIEATGHDRPGLLFEALACLSRFDCNVNAVELWTQNLRVAFIMYCTETGTGLPIESQKKLDHLKEALSPIMKGYEVRRCMIEFAKLEITNVDRRLHQLMHDDKRHHEPAESSQDRKRRRTSIHISKDILGYSMVSIQGENRPKLLFDIVCTLTDMKYVIRQASISPPGPDMPSEFYIRHANGDPLNVADERQLEEFLEAAIDRRTSEGSRIELRVVDRVGLLSDVTRIFWENGLSIVRASVTTRDDKGVGVFQMTGGPVDMKVVKQLQNLGIAVEPSGQPRS